MCDTEWMNYRSIGIAATVLLVLGGGYFFFGRGETKIVNYPSQGTDIVAFGDSLVFGEGASRGHDFVSLLSQSIGQPISNLGVPGDTTAQGLARIHELDTYHPKVVLLLLGGNDAIHKIPKEQVFQHLANILVELQKRGAIVLLLGVRGAVFSDPYASEFQKLADTYGAAYVPDVLDGLFGNPTYMSDEVHPNDAGYARIAARVEPVLKKLLQ